MNIAPLRKSIIKESIIFAVLIAIFGSIAMYLDMMAADYLQRKNVALDSANKLVSERRDMENRFTQVTNSMAEYDESQRWIKEPGVFLDSQAIRDLFNEYQPRFLLKKIGVEMQPITILKDDTKYARKNFVGMRTNAKVSIETASDEDIYQLIQALHKELPGFAKIKTFSLQKVFELNKEMMADIRKVGTFPTIKCEMEFDWYGMQSTDPANPMNKYVSKKHEEPQP